MTKQAWFCPSCQKHHAPHVDTCPDGKAHAVQIRTVNRFSVDAIGKDRMPNFPAAGAILKGYRLD